MSDPGIKICSSCGEAKLLTKFHKARVNKQSGVITRRADCADCHNRQQAEDRRERIRTQGEPYLQQERDRVHDYDARESVAEARKAADRAKHRALILLRDENPVRYEELRAKCLQDEGLV